MVVMNLKNIWIWTWKVLAIERSMGGFESRKICQESHKKPLN